MCMHIFVSACLVWTGDKEKTSSLAHTPMHPLHVVPLLKLHPIALGVWVRYGEQIEMIKFNKAFLSHSLAAFQSCLHALALWFEQQKKRTGKILFCLLKTCLINSEILFFFLLDVYECAFFPSPFFWFFLSNRRSSGSSSTSCQLQMLFFVVEENTNHYILNIGIASHYAKSRGETVRITFCS